MPLPPQSCGQKSRVGQWHAFAFHFQLYLTHLAPQALNLPFWKVGIGSHSTRITIQWILGSRQCRCTLKHNDTQRSSGQTHESTVPVRFSGLLMVLPNADLVAMLAPDFESSKNDGRETGKQMRYNETAWQRQAGGCEASSEKCWRFEQSKI